MSSPPGTNLQGKNVQHLDEMTVLLYLEGQLDRAKAMEVSAHTQECGSCRTLLRALEHESRLLTRAMLEEDEPLPARLVSFQQAVKRSMQWIWMVTFGLAATGVYALYTSYIEPVQSRLQDAGFGGTNLLGLLIFQGAFWKGWQSMISLIEILALVTIGAFAALLLRRRIRRGMMLAAVLATIFGAFLLPAGASATEFRHGDRVTIAKDEVIHSDLFVAGGRIRIEGTIEGDLFIGGGDVEITGHVLGDVISSSGSTRIAGQVDGNLRGYAGNYTVKGTVGHSVTLAGGDINIDRDAKIGGSVTAFSGRQAIDGSVGRDVLVMGGQSSISGTVNGAVRIRAGEFSIDSTAKIGGPVDFQGDKPPDVSPQAKLASPVHFEKLKHDSDYRSFHYYLWQIIWTAAYILFGMVLFSLMPKFSSDAANSLETLASAGLAVLAGAGVFVAAIIACATVVGLFIGVSALFLWMASLYFGLVLVGALIGQWLMGRTSELWPLIGRMAVGMVILRVFTMIPHVGWLVKYGAAFWGLGAIALVAYRRIASSPSVAVAPPMVA